MTDNSKPSDASAPFKVPEELSHLLDVPMKVTIELGNTRMRIREVLQLAPGSIVELPKSAGENIDVYINGQLLACGEVLELEGNTGIRITEVLQQGEENPK